MSNTILTLMGLSKIKFITAAQFDFYHSPRSQLKFALQPQRMFKWFDFYCCGCYGLEAAGTGLEAAGTAFGTTSLLDTNSCCSFDRCPNKIDEPTNCRRKAIQSPAAQALPRSSPWQSAIAMHRGGRIESIMRLIDCLPRFCIK
jgi:hypothetical protein